jgi:hypothetical protein
MVCPLGCPQMFAPPTFFRRVDFASRITQIAAFPYIAPAILVIWEGLGRFRFPTSPSPLEAFWAADPPGMGAIPPTRGATPLPSGGSPGRPSHRPSTSPRAPRRRQLAVPYVSGPGRPPAAHGGPGVHLLAPSCPHHLAVAYVSGPARPPRRPWSPPAQGLPSTSLPPWG